MEKDRIVFVVLHYNEPQVTEECIKAIQEKTGGRHAGIVVVDNGSPDGSGVKLAERYRGEAGVYVILTGENLGFAGGNNIGYAYAKKELAADFICVMNNDVMLLQEDFLERIRQEYEGSGAAVIGPYITLKNGGENHMYLALGPRSDYAREREEAGVLYRYYHSRLYPIRNVINQAIDTVSGKKKRAALAAAQAAEVQEAEARALSRKRHQGIVLHGCCLIFTPVYLARFEDAFDPRTFLFREEELLYLRLKRAGLDNVYTPALNILHLEDVSTNATYKTNRRREEFKCKCQQESLGILLNTMDELKKEKLL